MSASTTSPILSLPASPFIFPLSASPSVLLLFSSPSVLPLFLSTSTLKLGPYSTISSSHLITVYPPFVCPLPSNIEARNNSLAFSFLSMSVKRASCGVKDSITASRNSSTSSSSSPENLSSVNNIPLVPLLISCPDPDDPDNPDELLAANNPDELLFSNAASRKKAAQINASLVTAIPQISIVVADDPSISSRSFSLLLPSVLLTQSLSERLVRKYVAKESIRSR
ncbi:hypothetical protein L211DRAFT_851179 [Terfezia boudieri ATCC MYA-4762]|uniref:Uncharacterized protein n=1 Tax=Terfezia boudieri ATCC MYA-4762 TaxID=1051890 RepID=A0A3N4LJX2_9PEZI|nr:hypothetical protein L211DRAFT_851179 [Terfezia boudieri ATCC MYA-4762]